MERFQNKYRIASARAAWWDYGWAGAYFITICTAQRHHYFGNINQSRMQLSSVGILADVFWHEIRHHAQQVEFGAFVVMPNHIHGILILNNDDGNNDGRVSTPSSQRFQNQGKNTVSSIIGGYKSAVTKHAHRLGFDFGWQARLHDHIIRNDAEYQRINDYIEQNPARWDADKFYT
ncbi:transposase [Spirosoma sp. KNUC1025]|uniref:transposase n=1 Tax=Spirosoma sp. KNUC1025 TaxID=2894082 RepID=UPI001E47BE89|nr:transposase [Spirosoma sp. KNUC1025]UFH57956.1 transposase [Spirosoma sp. KNUC1025]